MEAIFINNWYFYNLNNNLNSFYFVDNIEINLCITWVLFFQTVFLAWLFTKCSTVNS